jgi:hypothetical protein
MKMHRSLTTLVAIGLLLAAAPAADAAVTRTFDFRTGTSVTEGHAHAWGNVTFRGRQVSLTGRLNDVCPGDGLGAYLRVFVYVRGSGPVSSTEFKDVGKCGDPNGVVVSYDYGGSRVVTAVKLSLREWDNEGQRWGDPGREVVVDNPNA